MKATARERIKRPHPVQGLRTTKEYASFTVDLSISLERDLADHRGVVFARAGTSINPLEHSRFNRRLIFINGDDPYQVDLAVAIAADHPSKIVLVQGEPLTLTEAHGQLFYFDQAGVISDRFQLRSVVSRADPLMRVEEIPAPASKEVAQ